MGVVHKLKEEIIDFIVQSKKNEKNLSCRMIAELVWRNYRVDVSKSSVNDILKKSQLSRCLHVSNQPVTLVLRRML